MADPTPAGTPPQMKALPAREGGIAPMPVPLTRFIGRELDIDAAAGLVRRDDVRLLTLTGPGGVGKTRLSIEVARRVEGDFADGACFVALAPVREAGHVPSAVATSLAIPERASQSVLDTLAGALRHRHLLLVLDNFEHLLAEAPTWLVGLLGACPGLTVLVTSRMALNVEGEQRYIVAPLPVPESDTGRAAEAASLRLFAQRAQAVNPGFSLDATNIDTVAAICGKLDGLPLAIELAAARIGVLDPGEILSRLTDRLGMLTGGHRDAPARMRSMRDAIGWSHDLLTPDEQAVFRRLSVFLGGFTLEAAVFVLAWPEPPGGDNDVLESLQSLVEQSLVQRAPGAGNRFQMLETIREFGLQASVDAGDADANRLAHAEYVIDLTRRAEAELIGPELPRCLDRLEADYANIIAAVDWLDVHGRIEDAVRVLSRIAYFLSVRGYWPENMARIARWRAHPTLSAAGEGRGLALKMWAYHLGNIGDLDRARQVFEEAAVLLQEAGNAWHEAQARTMLAGVCSDQGDHDATRRQVEAALSAARTAGNHRLVSINLHTLSEFADQDGDVDLAETLRAEAVAVAEESGDFWARARYFAHLAWRALLDGTLDEAERHAEAQRHLLETYRSKRELPGAWELLAFIARARGDLDLAAERVATGLGIAESDGQTWTSTHLCLTAGVIAMERGDVSSSVEALRRRLRALDPVQHPADVSLVMDAWALLAYRAGDTDWASRFHGASIRVLRDAGVADPSPFDIDITRLREALRDRPGTAWMTQAAADGAAVPVATVIAEALEYVPAPIEDKTRDEPPYGLSPRELEVLRLVAEGRTDQQIAEMLYISRRTAEWHVRNVLGKLGVANRAEAASRAAREGLV